MTLSRAEVKGLDKLMQFYSIRSVFLSRFGEGELLIKGRLRGGSRRWRMDAEGRWFVDVGGDR